MDFNEIKKIEFQVDTAFFLLIFRYVGLSKRQIAAAPIARSSADQLNG